MTMEERIGAVARLGFTERQARFLVHVMLFSGICLPRQYARFASTAYGHNVNDFFAKLVRDGHATAWASIHNRGRLYHASGRRLYDAVGEPRHPHRRPVLARQIVERLTRLDALVAEPNVRWLASREEQADYLRSVALALPLERLTEQFQTHKVRDKGLLPKQILIGQGEAVTMLAYVVRSPLEDEWRQDLPHLRDLLGGLPSWRFRAYFRPDFRNSMSRFHFAFADVFAAPSSKAVAYHLAHQTGRVHCVLLPVSYRYAVPLLTASKGRRRPTQGVEQGVGGVENQSARSQPQADKRVSLAESESSRTRQRAGAGDISMRAQ